MSELDKLQAYLLEHRFYFQRIDENYGGRFGVDRHQIIVYETAECTEEHRLWDAICQYGSYGYEYGLLEIMGVIVDEAEVGDTVEGYLTAEDVIDRIKAWRKKRIEYMS